MEKKEMTFVSPELSKALGLVVAIDKDLTKKKKDYQKKFLKQVKLLYSLFNEASIHSENWEYVMRFNIGTTEDEIPEAVKEKLALGWEPTYLEYLCNVMVGSFVLNKRLTCKIGHVKKEMDDVMSIIKQVADIVGLKVKFSIVKEKFRQVAYAVQYATFSVKK